MAHAPNFVFSLKIFLHVWKFSTNNVILNFLEIVANVLRQETKQEL